MSSTTLEALIIILLLIGNGLFAMSEIAVVSSRKARLQQWVNEGNAKARAALDLANAPSRFLSTVQIGITLVGILAGAFGGATIADRLAIQLSKINWLAPYSDAISFGIVVVVITYLSLVIGELTPKRLALQNPERIACAVAGPMQQLSRIASPIVHLLTISTESVLRLIGSRPSSEPHVTEEEIRVLIDQGTREGVFEEAEQDMVEGVFRLNNRRVGAIMTPRPEIVWLNVDAPTEDILAKLSSVPHTLFPVCKDNLDNVLGVVNARDLLIYALTHTSLDLQAALSPPLFVPENTLASILLEMFKQSETHLALVIDEYGGLQGIVSINDVLEEIVGDIELDSPQAVQRKDGSWLLDGMLPIHEFKQMYNIKKLPGEGRNNYETLAGFIMLYLGRIPSVADQFRWAGLRFEVIDMDAKRIDKVLVKREGSGPS